MARKQTKYGKVVSFYLTYEAIAKLIRLSGQGNKSRYVENLILSEYSINNPEQKVETEIKEVLDGSI